MARIDTTVRRWCESCQDFTKSRTDKWGDEVCSRCVPRDGEDG